MATPAPNEKKPVAVERTPVTEAGSTSPPAHGVSKTPVRMKEAKETKEQEAPTTIKDAVKRLQGMLSKLPPDPDSIMLLMKDIQADVNALGGMLGPALGAPAPGVAPETEGMPMMAEGPPPDELPGEPPAGPADEELPGMGEELGEGQEGQEHDVMYEEPEKPEEEHESQESESAEADAGQMMRYACAHCGETNDVLPPKGHRLSMMSESDTPPAVQDGEAEILAETVTRLQRDIERKEGRFVEANKDKAKVLVENVRLKAQLAAYKKRDDAVKTLKEAQIPDDLLSVKTLMEAEPGQWAGLVHVAKYAAKMESAPLNAGGAGPHTNASLPDPKQSDDIADAAIAAFREAYKR